MEEKTIGQQVAERRIKMGLPPDGSLPVKAQVVKEHETLVEEVAPEVEEPKTKKNKKAAH
jgi:hypothetical protein